VIALRTSAPSSPWRLDQWPSAAIGSTPPSVTAPTANAVAYQPLRRCTPQLNSPASSK